MVRVGRTSLLLGLLGALAVVGCGRTGVSSSGQKLGDGDGGVEDGDGGVGSDLAKVRAATAKYHRLEVAVQDGYVPAGDCVESPAGVMGYHYLNPANLGSLEITKPQLLLYTPKRGGEKQLVAVEYMVPIFHDGQPYTDAASPDPADVPPTPMLFGQPFDGPMAGHEPGMPWHFDLHVWIWRENPSGMFAQFNPDLSCSPPGDGTSEDQGDQGEQDDDSDEDGGVSDDGGEADESHHS